jgi:hypothetical protein
MLGSDPGPYEPAIIFETFYFSIALIPAVILGYAFWNEKEWALTPAIVYLLLDSPILLFRVLRLAEAGFLDSGLTQVFELGGLILDLVTLGWLFAYRSSRQIHKYSQKK